MVDPRPFTNVDPATAAALRRNGCDPHEVDQFVEHVLAYIYTLVPRPPFSDNGRLTALAASTDGVDRIRSLPDELLRNIVARLPVKDAARTAVLSTCWRTLWRSTPLVLSDAHLLPDGHVWPPTRADSPAVTAAVSRILEAHPGPFRCVDLVCSHMNGYLARLARWVQLLAAKGVQDLVLVNRPWPQDVPLPATLFSVSTLTSLYIGFWKLPSTDVLRGASFPHLVELGICSVEMEHGAIESLVARSPVLEILNIEGCRRELRLRLVSQSLRCVQICSSVMENITMVKAPCLERLIFSGRVGRGAFRVRIVDAPKLHTFGFLEPGQVLEVGKTVIMPGIKASTSTMLTTVKILSLNVRFGVRSDVEMVPTFLRCFPNVERLHIMSKRCDQPTGNHLTRKFWEESGPIENVVSRIHTMCLREFRGDTGEVGFLEFFFGSARALRSAFIVMANPRFTPYSTKEAVAKVRHSCENMASESSYQFVVENQGQPGGAPWNFKTGADFSFPDPFSFAAGVFRA
ncbi:hypothetical protein ACQJBY_013447 [Aegilops geniculata]